MQYLYLIFSSTDTAIGKSIRKVAKNKYNHLSVALGETPEKLYSFSRYYYTAPFYAGFVNESLNRYKNSVIKICRVPLTDEQYDLLAKKLKEVKQDKSEYIYNLPSAIMYPLKRRINKYRSYTCMEFGVWLLNLIGFTEDKFYTFQQLEYLLKDNIVYEGVASVSDKTAWGEDHYSEKLSKLEAIRLTGKNHIKLRKKKK